MSCWRDARVTLAAGFEAFSALADRLDALAAERARLRYAQSRN